jgi:integrase
MRSEKQSDGKPYKLALNRDGYYELRWTGADGTTKQRSTQERDYDAARATAQILWRDLARIVADSAKPTVRKICELYLANCESRQTTKGQDFSLRAALRVFGDRSDHPIPFSDFEAFTIDRRRQGFSDGAIRRELGALNAALRFGVKRRMITLAELPYIELPPQPPPRNNPATVEEINELWALALAASPPEGQGELEPITLFTTIAIATGARRGAVLELPWGKVGWNEGGRIILDFSSEAPASNRKKRRSKVPAPKMLEPILQRAYREALHRAGLIAKIGAKTPEIMADLRVCRVKDIRSQWATLIKKSRKKDLNIHDLRHSWATNHIKAGVDPIQIAEWLQDNLKTVMATYVHLKPDYLIEAADKLDISKG